MKRCPTCKRGMKRSNDQNALYWALLHLIEQQVKPGGNTFAADPAWHNYFKMQFLGADDIALPGGKVLVMPRSSSFEDVDAFSDYFTKVEAWAAERGVYLADREAA